MTLPGLSPGEWTAWSLSITLAALVIERLTGYPRYIMNAIGHPVIWMGGLITRLEKSLNRPKLSPARQRLNGAWALARLITTVLIITIPATLVMRILPYGWALEALAATSLIAQFDLRRYVAAVARGLDKSLDDGRKAVRHIVGRDPSRLDESDVARGAIESLAENASDGIIAPALWLALFGLPGIAVYKAVNTADSMIGYKSERYRNFGFAAAKLDDVLNIVPARLTGLLFAGAASLTSPARGADALQAMWRDAAKHASPNAGYPEAAIAGALFIRLGGPRTYQGRTVDLPVMGNGHDQLDASDIRRALRLLSQMLTMTTLVVCFFAVFMW